MVGGMPRGRNEESFSFSLCAGGVRVASEPEEDRVHFLVLTDVCGNRTHGVVAQYYRPLHVRASRALWGWSGSCFCNHGETRVTITILTVKDIQFSGVKAHSQGRVTRTTAGSRSGSLTPEGSPAPSAGTPLPPAPGTFTAFCLWGFAASGHFMYVAPHDVWPFYIGLLSLRTVFSDLVPVGARVSVLHSLSRLSDAPRCVRTPFRLSVPQLTDLWAVPTFCVGQVRALGLERLTWPLAFGARFLGRAAVCEPAGLGELVGNDGPEGTAGSAACFQPHGTLPWGPDGGPDTVPLVRCAESCAAPWPRSPHRRGPSCSRLWSVMPLKLSFPCKQSPRPSLWLTVV